MRGIVVGVDGSDGSRNALAWALAEARLRGVNVHAVHVWSSPSVGAAPLAPPLIDFEQLEDEARTLLDDVIAQADAREVVVHKHVYEGYPSRCLLDAAGEADLVVVGSRGRGGFAGLLLGSVSQQVAHHASCPVVVVPDRLV
jgi:nucleotide-binding universal stress UspA family protein